MKKRIVFILMSILFIAPNLASALDMPTSGNQLAEMTGVGAEAYIVADAKTGEVLISKNAQETRVPASLTKLVTVLVVLDSKVKMNKVVTMIKADQTAGACGAGGACIKSANGVKFTVDGLLHAALMPSANNAANALSRSTGLTTEEFVKKMNDKVKELGATNSYFYEPTGMDARNVITAEDYVKIASAAFKNSYVQKAAGESKYLLRSSNNSRYNQTIKNTNKLLKDPDITMVAAKTGYLDESGYNFSSLVRTWDKQELIVVVLGEKHLYSAFAETKVLTQLAQATRFLALGKSLGNVLGVNTNN